MNMRRKKMTKYEKLISLRDKAVCEINRFTKLNDSDMVRFYSSCLSECERKINNLTIEQAYERA